jgi:hypothetical protein
VNKPVAYWVQTEQIDKLCDRFGQTLNELTPREKASLRTVLSFWVSMQSVEQVPLDNSYVAVEDAWSNASISVYALCSEDVIEAVNILDGVTKEQANDLIRALSESLALAPDRQ